MDFQQVCELSALPAKTVEYYVEEKIVIPLYPRLMEARDAEYAHEDVIRLRATANLRRLDVPIPDIRAFLIDPKKAATFSIQHFSHLSDERKVLNARIDALGQLELGNFQNLEDMLETLSQLDIDLPLPARDVDHDSDRDQRHALDKLRKEVSELSADLDLSERSRRRYFVIILILLLISVVALGWIIGPILLDRLIIS